MADEAQEFMEAYMQRTAAFLERVMIFMDAGYWRSCLQDQFHRTDIDLPKVINKLLHGRRLVRTYMYTGRIEKPPNTYWRNQQADQQRWLTAMAHQPFVQVRLGKLQFQGDVPRQKGVDVLLALDMLRFALKENYDVALLISGDGDFADIVNMVKDEGRKVEGITFPGTCARTLLEACDVNIEITADLLSDCWR
jgi:uncharacterized LabA/DUF88 family protein